jgi:protein involved in polysaccharide export with SLBB domain
MGDDMSNRSRERHAVRRRDLLFALISASTALYGLSSTRSFAQVKSAAVEGPAGSGAEQGSVIRDASYRLGSGDHVRIVVYGQTDLTGEYLVDGAGNLAFPLIGSVQAGGRTADELSQEIISRLRPNYLKNPSVSVEVLTYRPFYVVGEVKTPGSYPYVSGMTVVHAVALAGGFTYRAREDSFYIQRGTGKPTRMAAAPDTPVEPGDVITVRERYF